MCIVFCFLVFVIHFAKSNDTKVCSFISSNENKIKNESPMAKLHLNIHNRNTYTYSHTNLDTHTNTHTTTHAQSTKHKAHTNNNISNSEYVFLLLLLMTDNLFSFFVLDGILIEIFVVFFVCAKQCDSITHFLYYILRLRG